MTTVAVAPKSNLPEVLKKITADLVKVDRGSVERVVTLPDRVAVTDEIQHAFLTYPAVLANTQVAPSEKRELTPQEVESMIAERDAIDVIQKVLDRRKDAIRTATFNHLDMTAPADADVTDKGYAVKAGFVAGATKKLTREVQEGSVTLSTDALQEQEGQSGLGDFIFTHEHFLACTTPVRVIDELKVLQMIRDTPAIQPVLARATSVGQPVLKHALRKL